MEYEKKFIIIGNMNAIAYKEVFPLIKDNKIWLGTIFNKSMEFRLGSDAEKWKRQDENGNKYGIVPGITWFTNLDHYQRHELLDISDYYYGNEDKYLKYENFDGIDVNAIDDIPCDFEGNMGVPITFIGVYNPEQFEIIGTGTGDAGKKIGVTKNYRGRTDLAFKDKEGNDKCPYNRVIVKLKNPKPKKEKKNGN